MSGNPDFGTFGRYTELQLDEMTADQRKAYELARTNEMPPSTHEARLQRLFGIIARKNRRLPTVRFANMLHVEIDAG